MSRFTIDKPILHDWWALDDDERDIVLPHVEDEHLALHLVEMFMNLIDVGAICGPPDRQVHVNGFDDLDEPACIMVHLGAAIPEDDEEEPSIGMPRIYEVNEYFDEDAIAADPLPLADLEAAVRTFVDQLNELDRWRLIKR